MSGKTARQTPGLGPAQVLPAIKGVIFDCDGVIVDSRRFSCFVYNYLLVELGLPPMTPAQEEFIFAQTAKESIASLFPPQHRAWAERVKGAMEIDAYISMVSLQPGILPLLQKLKATGRALALNTNGGVRALKMLKAFGIREYFSQVITAEDVRHPKPDPEGILTILSRWELSPAEAAFIGDSGLDREAALAAGVKFWSYRNRSLNAHWHLDDFGQVAGHLAMSVAAPG
jgi:HAD superfamily hydrolase (TIGR01509 family)